MFEDIETHKKLSKWIIGTFTACILIYLGIRHISHVADAVMWLKDLLNPLLIGLILALFLNVPLGVIERHLFPKHPTSRKTKMRRPLAILLSFILVIGVFVGVAFLVIPELIDAVSIVIPQQAHRSSAHMVFSELTYRLHTGCLKLLPQSFALLQKA